MKRTFTLARYSFGSLGVAAVLACLLLPTQAAAGQKKPVETRLAQTLREGGDFSSGDLDGDHLSDVVLTTRGGHSSAANRHTLEISLSTGAEKQTFNFPVRRGGLYITARDVDGDLDRDLVVTSRVTGEGIGILINDGLGVFSEGDAADRKPWVWGHGARLIAGATEDTSVAAPPAGTEDAATIDQQSDLEIHPIAACQLIRSQASTTQARGAFYIRPPPSSL